jgi:putative heme iron utilization protein
MVTFRLACRTMVAEGGRIKLRGKRTMTDPAFAARCLLRAARWATLATSAGGQPFASLVTHAVAPDGAMLLLLSALADHTQHLMATPRCALMVTGAPDGLNWQTAPRVTVSGHAERLEDPAARAFWLARHPYAREYAVFTDFSVWRLLPEHAVFIAGFGQAMRLPACRFLPGGEAAAAVAAISGSVAAATNESHKSAINRLADAAGCRGSWRLLGIDIDGLDLVQDDCLLRVAFKKPAASAAEAQTLLASLLAAR